jgi:hypothetical protein
VDFWDLTRLVLRRWYVAAPLVAVTIGATFFVTSTVKPDYKATSYVQLIPPATASATTNTSDLRNPWLELGLGSLNTAATYATVDKTFLNQLKSQGLSDSVVITEGYPAPIVTIDIVAASQLIATQTTDQVVKHFDETVKGLQDDYGVKPNAVIRTRRLDTGRNLAQTGGKVKRALVAVAGAGMLLTVGLTIGFDAAVRRRAGRRGQNTGSGGAGTSAVNGNAFVANGNGPNESTEHLPVGVPAQRDAAGWGPPPNVPSGPPSGSEVTIVLPQTFDPRAKRDGGGRWR